MRTGEHATSSTYSLGCRCAHCTYANTSYKRARREALRGDVAPRHRGPERRGRPESRDGWISPQWFGDVIWRPALQRAGLEWLHWHDLRHAHATWLLAAGVPARSVMKRLGHKNLATTEIYLSELVGVEDIASLMGAYHSIFASALRGELWDPRADAEHAVLAQAAEAVKLTAERVGELLAQLPPEQVAALLTQVLTRGRGGG